MGAGGRGAQALGRAERAWQACGRWQARGHGRTRRRALAGARTRADAQAGASGTARRQARARAERAGQGWLGAGRAAWARGLALGCALGALGLFLPGSTWYFPESKFLDIVREPGS